MTLRRNINVIIVGLAMTATLVACGDDEAEPTAQTAAPSTVPTAAPSAAGTDPTSWTTETEGDHLLMALEALAPDFPDAKSCADDSPPEVHDVSEQNLLTGAEWYGKRTPDAQGVRPTVAWKADFCMTGADSAIEVSLDILEFDAPEDAEAWIESIRSATAGGQAVVRGEEDAVGCAVEKPKVATLSEHSIAGADAVDVVVDDPCSLAKEFPEFKWESPIYSFGAGGRYVVIVFVEESSGSVLASNDEKAVEATETIAVARDKQRAVIETLTEQLADED